MISLAVVFLALALATIPSASGADADQQNHRQLPLGHLPEPALKWETRLPNSGTEDRYVCAIMLHCIADDDKHNL